MGHGLHTGRGHGSLISVPGSLLSALSSPFRTTPPRAAQASGSCMVKVNHRRLHGVGVGGAPHRCPPSSWLHRPHICP